MVPVGISTDGKRCGQSNPYRAESSEGYKVNGCFKCTHSKRKVGYRWGCLWIRQETWWKRTWRKLRSMPSFLRLCWQNQPSGITGLWGQWESLEHPPVKEFEVRKCLKTLDVHKSMGPDVVYPQVLRALANVIARPILTIFGRWRQQGEVPEDWKKTNVSPVFKKDEKEDPEKYRVVGCISVPGKLMETAKVLNAFFVFPSKTKL